MRQVRFLLLVPAVWMMGLSSCKKDEGAGTSALPVVIIKEVGANNSKVAYPDTDLHLDADIQAPGKIVGIKVQITLAETNYGWDFRKTYTQGYEGLKNAKFHEHIDIPQDARAGKYTVLLLVADALGEKSQDKVDFEIKADASLPAIKDRSLKVLSRSTLNLSGTIQALGKVNRIELEVQSAAWSKKFLWNEPAMVDQQTFQLDKNIDITGAPAGHYHINVTLFDQVGKSVFYQFHLDRQ